MNGGYFYLLLGCSLAWLAAWLLACLSCGCVKQYRINQMVDMQLDPPTKKMLPSHLSNRRRLHPFSPMDRSIDRRPLAYVGIAKPLAPPPLPSATDRRSPSRRRPTLAALLNDLLALSLSSNASSLGLAFRPYDEESNDLIESDQSTPDSWATNLSMGRHSRICG